MPGTAGPLDVEADGRSATIRAPGPGHRHHLDRHRHSQDRAHLTPPDHSAREGPDQRTDIKMTEPTDNELRPLTAGKRPFNRRAPSHHTAKIITSANEIITSANGSAHPPRNPHLTSALTSR